MADAKEIKAQVTLEEMKQFVDQALHGYKQDPAATDFQRGHLSALQEFADFFKLHD